MIVPEPRRTGRKHLTMKEWRNTLSMARSAGLFEHVLLRTLYETGMRASEPGALVFDHLKRLRERPPQLYVPRGKGSVTGWQDISRDLADLVAEWALQAWNLSPTLSPREIAMNWPAAPVFPGRLMRGRRKGITRRTVWSIVSGLMEQAGVPPELCYPHAIKHSRVQHLFEEAERQGLPPEAALKTVANIVGHRSAQTSWEHYVGETGRGRKVADAVLKKATGG